jgi:UDP-N-acetylmuramate dehydrogenase
MLINMNLIEQLKSKNLQVKEKEFLSAYTTIGVGGPALILTEVKNIEELKTALSQAKEAGVSYMVMGRGSNLVISDAGFDGLVILNNTSHWEIVKENIPHSFSSSMESRFAKIQGSVMSFNQYLNRISAGDMAVVRADSGLRVNTLSKALYKNGIVGLEWFAGIPATIGGGIYMNMHGGPLFLGDLLYRACIFNGRSEHLEDKQAFKFDYDYSILHETNDTVLWVELLLWKGDTAAAAKFTKEWAKEKAYQPRRSAGCIFQNLPVEEQRRLKLPTPSAGYLIDKLLNLKDTRIGGAVLSPSHAAFIENTGDATAQDVYDLIALVRRQAREKLGLDLKLEVKLIGPFKQE